MLLNIYLYLAAAMLLAIISGILLSKIAKEEMQELDRYFIYARSVIMIAIAAIAVSYDFKLNASSILTVIAAIGYIIANHQSFKISLELLMMALNGLLFYFIASTDQYAPVVLIFLLIMISGSHISHNQAFKRKSSDYFNELKFAGFYFLMFFVVSSAIFLGVWYSG